MHRPDKGLLYERGSLSLKNEGEVQTITIWLYIVFQARSQGGGGVGGVATPPSGINDIHNTNYVPNPRKAI